MPAVTASADIRSGPEPIWQLFCEPERYPDYVPATHRMLDVPTGEFGLGTTYREYGGVPPFFSESDWEVTEFSPMSFQRHVGDDGKMRMLLDCVLEQAGEDATRVTLTLTMQPHWYLAVPNLVLWPLMMRSRAQHVMDETVANVKRIVEAEAAA